jgi:hypothetical protein
MCIALLTLELETDADVVNQYLTPQAKEGDDLVDLIQSYKKSLEVTRECFILLTYSRIPLLTKPLKILRKYNNVLRNTKKQLM